MIFTGKVKHTSTIYTDWISKRKLSGQIEGVTFKLAGMEYTTETLSRAQVAILRLHRAVLIEGVAVPIQAPRSIAAPPPESPPVSVVAPPPPPAPTPVAPPAPVTAARPPPQPYRGTQKNKHQNRR